MVLPEAPFKYVVTFSSTKMGYFASFFFIIFFNKRQLQYLSIVLRLGGTQPSFLFLVVGSHKQF